MQVLRRQPHTYMKFTIVPISCTIRCRGRAIAQAVSRLLHTAEAWLLFQVRSRGICGGESFTGAGFLRVLRFPLPILIPPTPLNSSSSIIRGWYNRPNSGRRTKWAQSHSTPRKSTRCCQRAGNEEFYLLWHNVDLPPAFMLVSCLAYSSTLKIEAIYSSEISADFRRATSHYIPEDKTLLPFHISTLYLT
jgi:hypothetical protein